MSPEPARDSEREARDSARPGRRARGLAAFLGRVRWAAKNGFRFWASRPALLSVVVILVSGAVAFGGVRALTWMETPEFCGRCHTMQPEVEAHVRSSHETVECAECHVGGGVMGLVKSKWDGMVQMVKLLTGSYARPIEPAAHGMPPADETCLQCHNPARQRGDILLARSHFQEDKTNTEQRVALVVRLASDPEQQTTGIHWHVLSKVEFVARDPEARSIDWIGVELPDGTRQEFIAGNVVEMSQQAGRRAAELREAGSVQRMTCYDCHNRVGHSFPSPTRATDEAMAAGRIDVRIPSIKKLGVEVISRKYESLEEAERAINDLGESYHQQYPNLYLERPDEVTQSLVALAGIYRETAYPEMQAFAQTYPSYLGHVDAAGCFRCHDGGHYRIENGGVTDEAIPSRCSLCHTFPTVGGRAPNVMLGPPPSTHENRLWIFDHSVNAASDNWEQASCSSCHSQTYCSNCHSTGAMSIKHDNMFYDHAAVIRETTEDACGYCHQKPFCERCHGEDGEE